MSIQGQRAEIVSALSTVAVLKPTPYRPASLHQGAAWPLLDSLVAAEPQVPAFEVSWRVVVVLPNDEIRASEWFDEHHEEIAEALLDVGFVARIEPANLATSAGDMPVMILTMRREA